MVEVEGYIGESGEEVEQTLVQGCAIDCSDILQIVRKFVA